MRILAGRQGLVRFEPASIKGGSPQASSQLAQMWGMRGRGLKALEIKHAQWSQTLLHKA